MSERDALEAIFVEFRDAAAPHIQAPGTNAVRTAVRRQRQRRVALVAAAVVLTVVAGGATALASFDRRGVPPANRKSPSPTASATPSEPAPSASSPPPTANTGSDRIKKVDWKNATLEVPPTEKERECPAGRIQMRNGTATVGGREFSVANDGVLTRPPEYGDLTGDGSAEAVLHAFCNDLDQGGGASEEELLAITMRGDQLVVLGFVGSPALGIAGAARIIDGQVITLVGEDEDESNPPTIPTQKRTYRWTGSRFEQVGGFTRLLELGDGRPVRLPTVTRPDGSRCAGGTVTFRNGQASVGGTRYGIESARGPWFTDLNQDGNQEVLWALYCTPSGDVPTVGLYLMAQRTEGLIVIDVPFSGIVDTPIESVTLEHGFLQVVDVNRKQYNMTWTTGKGFQPRVGSWRF